MIDMKRGVLRFYICFYFVVYVLQLNALLILFSFKKDHNYECEYPNESFLSPFKIYPSPFFLFPPLRKKRASKIYENVAIQLSSVINEQETETHFSCLWFQNLKIQWSVFYSSCLTLFYSCYDPNDIIAYLFAFK